MQQQQQNENHVMIINSFEKWAELILKATTKMSKKKIAKLYEFMKQYDDAIKYYSLLFRRKIILNKRKK